METNAAGHDPRIGRALGRYHIEKRLGRGGMGVVYQARQLSLNRPVAIKVLPPQMAADAEFRDRFRREAHAVAALSHENIVHVYDIEEADGALFLVMELVPGQTLRQLRERRGFAPAEIRTVGLALARALGHAHRQGIIHRDVKTANVMVTPAGAVKLMDFGIARVEGAAGLTMTGNVLGTPEFMAPEYAQTGVSTPQTDLYALGVVLFELATGRVPFSGTAPFQIAYQHIHQPPPRPRELDPTIPEWLERVILRLLEKDPARRYRSAGELEQELAAAPVPAATAEASVTQVPFAVAVGNLGNNAPTVVTSGATVGRGTYATLQLPRRPGPWLAAAGALVLASGIAWWVVGTGRPVLPGPEPDPPCEGPPERCEGKGPAGPTKVDGPVNSPRNPPGKPPVDPPVSQPPLKPPGERPEIGFKAPPPADLPVSATFHCRREVEFHVSPEEALVVIDDRPLGPADNWDGMGGAPPWQPAATVSRACFRLTGYRGTCVRIVLDATAKEDVCDVDTELEEIEEP